MKKALLFLVVFVFGFVHAQFEKEAKYGMLSPEEYETFKTYLKSKNIEVKDTIYIKYDFNIDGCRSRLNDGLTKYSIRKEIQNNQCQISSFNQKHNNSIAVVFRESGNDFDKVKLMDDSILIDEQSLLKKMLFKGEDSVCVASVIVLDDGSYLLYKNDRQFSLLCVLNQKIIKNK